MSARHHRPGSRSSGADCVLYGGFGLSVIQLFTNVIYNIGTFARVKFPIHPAKGNTDDVAMMKFAAEFITQLEPQLVNEVDVFRPEAGWMRSQVHKYRGAIR